MIKLLVFIFTFLSITDADSFEVDQFNQSALNPTIYWFKDKTYSANLGDIQALPKRQWQKLPQNTTPNFGFTDSAYWFLLNLQNSRDAERRAILEIAYPLLDHIDIYIDQNGQQQHLVMGDQLPFSERPIEHRNFLVPITFQPNQQIQIYLRVKTTSSMQFPLTLWQYEDFFQSDAINLLFMGIFYGAMLIFSGYNLIIFLLTRERSYLYFVGYVLLITLFESILRGLTFQYFWPNQVQWHHMSAAVLLSSGLVFVALFVNNFLQLKHYYKKLHYLFIVIIMINSLLIASAFVFPYSLVIQLEILLSLPLFVMSLVVGGILWHHGLSLARHFTIAWIFFFLGGICLGLNKMGILPRNILTEYSTHIGLVLATTFLSLALSDRINYLKGMQAEITEKAKKAVLENEQKSQFLAMMSHELRTPMNGVLGMLQLLNNSTLTAQQQQYVSTIQKSGQILLNIINDTLDYSKIIAGKLLLEHKNFDLLELIDDSVQPFYQQADAQAITLDLVIDADVPAHICGDSTRLNQVINNLLSNAFKFTQQGTIRLKVSHVANLDNTLKFEVNDTGIGLSQDQQQHIFDAFSQADVSTTRKYGGTGLGLAICKQLCLAMGGNIGVSSELDKGTLFWFTITYANAKVLADQTDTTVVEAKQPQFELKVLVAEDDEINIIVIKGMLAQYGIKPVIVNNGLEAVAAYQTDTPYYQLILMDCEMPKLDGYQATRQIRDYEQQQIWPATNIVALSAHALPEHQQACRDAGMDDFLAKPLLLQALEQVLNNVA